MNEKPKQNGQDTAVKPGTNDIRSLIVSPSMKRQFALALPKHLTPDRFTRVALTAINKNPKLLYCTKESLLACLLDCSQLGIEPDGRNAHLIPYGNKCTLIIDYKGLVGLARRSGEIADIHADVVYENDDFQYSFGSDGKLVHRPALKGRGELISAYSFVRLKDGSSSYEVMNVEEINAIRKRSKAKDEGPWKTDWNEMAKKTVFRRHSKWLPVSSEFQDAIDKDYDVPFDLGTATPRPKADVNMPEALPPATTSSASLDSSVASESEVAPPSKTVEWPGEGPAKDQPGQDPYGMMLRRFEAAKKHIGNKVYYNILKSFGFQHANQIKNIQQGEEILGTIANIMNTGE